MAWERKQLGSVFKLEYGKPLPKEDRATNGGFPAYGANGILCRATKFYRDKPTIIVGRKGSAGEVNLTEDKYWPTDVTFFVEFDRNQYDLMFLFHVLRFLKLQTFAKGVKPGINRNDIYDLEFAFPPLPEQRRIVALLDEAFAGLEVMRANAEKNLANARELFDGYLNAVFTQKGEGWNVEPLNMNVQFVDYRGKTPPKRETGVRLITAKNVKMGFIRREPEEFIDSQAYKTWMTRGFPEKGDVLFTTEAPLGNVAQLDTDEQVVIGQRLITMKPRRAVLDRSFLAFMLRSKPLQDAIHARATGATVQGIKAKLLKDVPIAFPNKISDQELIARRIAEVEKRTLELESLYRQKLAAIAELKQSILQKAFAGELTSAESIAA